jgi:1-acyl-sn-glycerol-3-phosphate acyltransferase
MLIAFLLFLFSLLSILVMIGLRANQADWGSLHANVLDGLLRLFCFRYHRLNTDEINLPEAGPAIVACNHISGLDPFLVFAACKRPVHFLIAEDQYRRFGATWLFKLAGCIPVDTKGRGDGALRAAAKALADGSVIALFPQGGIHREHKPRNRLKRGVYKLAEMSGAPVYPLHIRDVKGAGHVLGSILQRGHPVLQSFPPIDCTDMDHKTCLKTLAHQLKVAHS